MKILFYFFAIFLLPTFPAPVVAQITPDSTLGKERSIVIPSQSVKGIPSDVISGGAVRADTLFHSFTNFDVNSGKGTYFINPSGVNNIVNRVTGNSASHIFGTIGVLGEANLYFLNPNGIIFGPGAALDLNGSFFGTTASSLSFANGTKFSAKNPQPVPLLSIRTPTGLDFTQSSGTIQVRGPGAELLQPTTTIAPPVTLGPLPKGLAVNPGKTLAIVGGNLQMKGGVITAPSGNIELGSVSSGQVKIVPNSLDSFSLSYESVKDFRDISLAQQSFLNASGTGGGEIDIVGHNVELTDNSLAFIENQGFTPAGDIRIHAANLFAITGDTEFTKPLPPGFIRRNSGLLSQTFFGKGADIDIQAKNFQHQNQANIYLSTFGSGAGGNLRINTEESIKVANNPLFVPQIPISSVAITITSGTGSAGNITLNTKHMALQDGAEITTATVGSGKGGNLSINASESITLTGFNPLSLFPTLLSSVTLGSGAGGNLAIKTNNLKLQNGGRVDASTLSSGKAGGIVIDANLITLEGVIPGSVNPTLIIASGNRLDPYLEAIFGLPLNLTGDSGNVKINAQELTIRDGAQLTVKNDGSGNAGNIVVNAKSINLENQGGITASTVGGNGGNIDLKSENVIISDRSSITASAQGLGDGGNVILDQDLVVLLKGSSISANATQGTGGRVTVTTQGLFVSPDSGITATSERGPEFSGVVELNVPNIDFSRTATQPVNVFEEPDVITACDGSQPTRAAAFINSLSSGIPVSPTESLAGDLLWHGTTSTAQALPNLSKLPEVELDTLPEAQGWIENPNGTYSLTADLSKVVPQSSLSSLCR